MRKTITACSIGGCNCGGKIRKGLCQKHYTRMRTHGDPLHEMPTLSERFHSRYDIQDQTDCWIWNGALSDTGYGAIQLGVKNTGYAHRVSWELVNGPIPGGLFVCHKCDTPACVNPAHLFLGSHLKNMQDMASKKRSMLGEKNNTCKLTKSDVVFILGSEESPKSLAAKFGVSKMTIWRIRTGKNWSDVIATRDVFNCMTYRVAPQIRLAA